MAEFEIIHLKNCEKAISVFYNLYKINILEISFKTGAKHIGPCIKF